MLLEEEQSDQGPHCLYVCMLKLVLDVSIYMKLTTSLDNIFKHIFIIAVEGLGLLFPHDYKISKPVRYWKLVQPLKHQEKMYMKMLSAEVVCCK